MKPLSTPRLADADAERARRQHVEAIKELQDAPASSMRVVADVQLVDSVETPVSHGLGRAFVWAKPGSPRGASSTGRIDEVRAAKYDRTQYVVLKATGWGATITVDVAVM